MAAFFYDLIYCLTITGLITSAYVSFSKESVDGLLAALTVVLCTVFFTGLKKASGRYRILIGGAVLAFVLGLYIIIGREKAAAFLNDNGRLSAVLAICIASFLFNIIAVNRTWIKRLTAGAVIIGAVYILFSSYPVSKAMPALMFMYILTVLSEEAQRYWSKSGYTEIKTHTVLVSPFIILMCLFVVLFPAREKPYDWKFAVDLYYRAAAAFNRINFSFVRGKDSFAQMGFSDENSFSSGLIRDDREIIRVISSGNGEIIYLSGAVFDSFDGNSWEATVTKDAPVRDMDALETLAAVSGQNENRVTDYVREGKVSVEYTDYYSYYLFVPVKSLPGQSELHNIKYTEAPMALKTDKKLGTKTSYRVSYLRLNNNDLAMQSLTENALPIKRESWEKLRDEWYGQEKSGLSYDDYMAYKERIKGLYRGKTQVSAEVRAMLDELFIGAESDYEKLKRVEGMLKDFSYSATPGDLPEDIDSGEDFLDWFLLNKRSGYCTHFATAFALIADAEGYPVRYVQGYRANVKKGGYATLKGSDAHSWPEVYFENVGWIPFEPTPGYSLEEGWEVSDGANDDALISAAGMPSGLNDDVKDTETAEEDVVGRSPLDLRLILWPVLSAVIFALLFIITGRIIARARFNRLDTDSKTRVLCSRNLKVMSLLGDALKDGETLSEYRVRAADKYRDECLNFIEIYDRLLYADHAAGEAELNAAKSGNKLLLKLLTRRRFLYRIFMW